MLRVKLFSSSNIQKLETEVNDFFYALPEENLIDIKISSSGDRDRAYDSVLVLFRDEEDEEVTAEREDEASEEDEEQLNDRLEDEPVRATNGESQVEYERQ